MNFIIIFYKNGVNDLTSPNGDLSLDSQSQVRTLRGCVKTLTPLASVLFPLLCKAHDRAHQVFFRGKR